MSFLAILKKRLPNLIENIFLMSITAFVIIKIMSGQIKEQNVLIEKLASQEKYKIENRFEKIKTAGDGKMVLELDNQLYHVQPISAQDTVTTEIKPEKRKGFLGRLFTKNKNK